MKDVQLIIIISFKLLDEEDFFEIVLDKTEVSESDILRSFIQDLQAEISVMKT